MHHDALIAETRKLAAKLTPAQVGEHLLAKLGSAPEDAADLLKAWAVASNLPAHGFHPSPAGQPYSCIVCGAHDDDNADASYVEVVKAHDVLASSVPAPHAQPTGADFERLDALLAAVESVGAEDGHLELDRALAPVLLRTNKYARRHVVEALGSASILDTPDHPGHLTRWRGYWEHSDRPSLSAETEPPAVFWRGRDGVNRYGLDAFFPQLELAATRRRFTPRAPDRQRVEARASKLPSGKGGQGRRPRTELGPGDVIHIEVSGEAGYLTALVWGWCGEGSGELPVVELFAGVDAAPPTLATLKKRAMRLGGPFRDAPHGRREALAVAGLELFGTAWKQQLVKVASPAPQWHPALKEPPPRYRCVLARNLGYATKAWLAETFFEK